MEEEDEEEIILRDVLSLLNETDNETIDEIGGYNLNIFALIYNICPNIFYKSLALIDNKNIIIYSERVSLRKLYIVNSERNKGQSYFVFESFCSCHSFIEQVLYKKNEITCKHQLACQIVEKLYLGNIINNEKTKLKDILTLNMLTELEFSNKLYKEIKQIIYKIK